jgi:hypothetical protein
MPRRVSVAASGKQADGHEERDRYGHPFDIELVRKPFLCPVT